MVSIIIPVYNAEKYLRECVESVLNQDYIDIELILIDDGSIDNSSTICQSFKDPRVKYIKKENGGVSSARNEGLRLVSGEYVSFLDSDDTLPSNAISSLFCAIENNEVDVAMGPHCFMYENSYLKHSTRLHPGVYEMNTLLSGFIDDGTLSGFLLGSVCGAIYKTDIIRTYNITFDSEIKHNEDGLFNLEYALYAKKLAVISIYVYNYRQYAISSSKKSASDNNYNLLIVNRINNLAWDKDSNQLENQLKARNVSLALWDILGCANGRSLKDGISFISKRIESPLVKEGLLYVRFDKLSIYKKAFAYMIKYKLSLMLWLSVRYVYPILGKRLKR